MTERKVRAALIQATLCEDATAPIEKIKKAMIDKHVGLIAEAASKGAEIVCFASLAGRVDLALVVRELGRRGVNEVPQPGKQGGKAGSSSDRHRPETVYHYVVSVASSARSWVSAGSFRSESKSLSDIARTRL